MRKRLKPPSSNSYITIIIRFSTGNDSALTVLPVPAMSTNPALYRGVENQDVDDVSSHDGASQRLPFNIARNSPTSTFNRPKLSLVTFLYVLSTLMFIILSIMGVAYLADIQDMIHRFGSSESGTNSYADLAGGSTTEFSLSKDSSSGSLLVRVPHRLVNDAIDLLMIEQLTSGMGNRDLFWDPGSIIAQDVVRFQTIGSEKLRLIAQQQAHRGDTSLMQRSFPGAVLWTFDVLHSSQDGYLISVDDFLLSGVGTVHGNDIPTVIAAIYGAQYVYSVDRQRSGVDSETSTADGVHLALDRNLTYTLTAGTSPVSAVGRQFTLSARRTLLLLDAYEQSLATGAGQKYTKYRPRPYHPMSGFNSITYMDESAGLTGARQQLHIVRHRLFTHAVSPGSNIEGSVDSAGSNSVEGKSAASAGPPRNALLRTTHATPKGMESSTPGSTPTATTTSNTEATAALPSVPIHAQLVYFVDATAPVGIREALTEGIDWWDAAFQAAGYPRGTFYAVVADRTAFDAYALHSPKRNFVEWIDRDWRSYSVGTRIEDLRSGEILKGHVRIENLRMRQDALVAEALLGPFAIDDHSGDGGRRMSAGLEVRDDGRAYNGRKTITVTEALQLHLQDLAGKTLTGAIDSAAHHSDVSHTSTATSGSGNALLDDIVAAILQRVRQLGAHEVGHTLGLAHNFAGSSAAAGYASVMDYPPPIVTVDASGTELVLNAASYATGIGAFDKVAITYGYKQFGAISAAQEQAALDALLQNAIAQGYVFLTDQDAAVGGGDWRDTQWDSGRTPIAALNASLTVRALALQKLQNVEVLELYEPYSQLQELFPIVYLWHRYEVEACAKLVGGYSFQYDTRTTRAGAARTQVAVPAVMQLAAVDQLIGALDPLKLAIPPLLAQRLLPTAFGYIPDIGGTGDLMPTRTGSGTFDLTASTEVAAELVLNVLFHPARLERLAAQSFQDSSLPDLSVVLSKVTGFLFDRTTVDGAFAPVVNGTYAAATALMTAQAVYVNHLLTGVVDVVSHSFGVRTALQRELSLVRTSVGALAVSCGGQDAPQCGVYDILLNAHVVSLQSAIAAGKPIVQVGKTPLGPPI